MASIFEAVCGPNASGVISLLPSPTTSTLPSGTNCESSSENSSHISRKSFEKQLNTLPSRVIYFPFFLPIFSPCLSSAIFISVILNALPLSILVIPSLIFAALILSSAKSVLILIFSPFLALLIKSCALCFKSTVFFRYIILKLPIAF